MSSIQGDEVLQMMIPIERHDSRTPLLSRVSVAFHQRIRRHTDARKPESASLLTPWHSR